MKNKHLAASIIIGAFTGATVTFLIVHEPTKKKIIKHAKIVHKKTLIAFKEKVNKIKV